MSKALSLVRSRPVVLENTPVRYLFAGYNPVGHDATIKELTSRGNEVTTISDLLLALERIPQLKPEIVVIRAFFPKGQLIKMLEPLLLVSQKVRATVVVMSPRVTEEDIKTMVELGVSDFVLIPCESKLLIKRLEYQLSRRKIIEIDEILEKSRELTYSLKLISNILRALSKSEEEHSSLHHSLKLLADFTRSPRINLFIGKIHLDQGTIVASSDSEQIKKYTTKITRYPEVREVLLKGHIVHVTDVARNQLTATLHNNIKSIKVHSIVVLPILFRSKVLGALHIRLSKDHASLPKKYLNTFYNVALALGPSLYWYLRQTDDTK